MLRGVGGVAQLVSPQLVASCSWEVVTRLLQAAHQPTPALLLLRPAQVGRGEVGVAGVEGVVEGRDHGKGAAPGGAVVHGGRGGAGPGPGGGAVTSSAMSTLPLIHSTAGLPRLTASSSPTLNLIPEKIKCMFFMSTVKKVESLYSKQPLNSYI